MPRRARNVFPGVAHHVTQRGNNRQQVFFSSSDYELYLDRLIKNCRLCGVAITAYCLMPNHIHLIGVPDAEDSLSKSMGRTHSEYALSFNRTTGRSGHLWQNRFFSCPLDRDHLGPALRYVELNPVRAGLVDEVWQWPWSSAAAGRRGGTERLGSQLSEEDVNRIRRATRVGEPLGSKKFILDLERRAGRGLRVRGRGRPRTTGPETGGVQEGLFSE